MLKIALKYNPDIRTAEAKRQLAEAELARTRMDVVKALTTYRTHWQFASIALKLSEAELKKARIINTRVPGTISAIELDRLALDVEKARMSFLKIESELPFLMGKVTGKMEKRPVEKTGPADALHSKSRDLAKQIISLKTNAFRSGNGKLSEIIEWSRRLVDSELALAKSKADRIVAVDAYRNRLTSLKKNVEAAYRARQTSQSDVLVVTFHVLQAEQLMQQTKTARSSSN